MGSGWGLWDLRAGRFRVTVPGSFTAAVSPDGRVILTAPGNVFRRWDAATGRPLGPDPGAAGHTSWVLSLAYAPAGDRVATLAGFDDRTVRLWDPRDGRLVATHPVPPGLPVGVRWAGAHLAFTAAGRHLALQPHAPNFRASNSGAAVLTFDPVSGRVVRTTPCNGGRPVPGERFWPPQFAAGGRAARLLRVWPAGDGPGFQAEVVGWDPDTGDRLPPVPAGRTVECNGLKAGVDPSGRVAVVGPRAVDIPGGGQAVPLRGVQDGQGCAPAFSARGRFVALADYRRTNVVRPEGEPFAYRAVGVWDTRTGAAVGRFPDAAWPAFRLTPDGRYLVAVGRGGLEVWEVGTGRRVLARPWPASDPVFESTPHLAVAPDGRAAVTAPHEVTQSVAWDLTAAALGRTPAGCWDDLGGPAPARAYAAVWRLAAGPDEAVIPLLRDRLRAAAPDPARVAGLVSALDAPGFAAREAAYRELERLGSAAGPALRAALRGTASAEVRDRAGRLAARLDGLGLPPDALRDARGVATLERRGTGPARALLAELAGGPPDVFVTDAARSALERLGARGGVDDRGR